MIHDVEIELMRRAQWREQRLFLEPRCNFTIVTTIAVALGAGAATAATIASVVVGTISLAAAGTSIAAAVGAFAPDNPGGNGTESTVAPQQQIIDLQTNLATLAAQEKKVESDLAVSQAASKKWQYAAIGVGVVAVVAAAFIAMEKNKKS